MENDDIQLIKACINGDRSAFSDITSLYSPLLMGYLMRMCSSRQQAEDCFQETFKTVYEKAHTLRKPERFKTWLFRIATNTAVSALRKQGKRQIFSLNSQPDHSPTDNSGKYEPHDGNPGPDKQAIKTERRHLVKQALLSLPEKQRAALVLVYYQQLNYPLAAEVLKCSTGTIKQHMFRALRKLAEKLPPSSGEII